MTYMIRLRAQWTLPMIIGVCLLVLCINARPVLAITQIPTPSPKPGSIGLEATKTQPPPTQGATITTPGNGASFTSSPITVNGICPTDLLVQLYNNGVMVGSVMCKGGSFSLQVSLFAGTNDLTATVYDDLEQAGPTSSVTTVTYTDTRFSAFGTSITLTSSYGRRSTAAGTVLGWPLQLSGGTGPYAFSTDWGDGAAPELKSQSLAGVVTLTHAYKKAGIYQVNIKVTDVNGVSAFLQVIAVSNGKVDGVSSAANGSTSASDAPVKVLWIPAAVSLILLVPAFWLGRLSQLTSLRNKMLKERGTDTQA
jgi:hypothetical protein